MKISNKQLYIFLLIVAAVKIFFSFFLELGNDESYYYTYALQPQLNYFDHPPMVGILMRFTTLNLTFVNDVLLRLGAIICCFIASVFVFKIGKLLHSEKAGWYAVLIYNFSIYTTFIAGFFILPDSPQMPFWCASLYMMCKIVFEKRTLAANGALGENNTSFGLWTLLGILIGLATLSKVHALYLWGGFGLFILFYKIKWLLNWRLYLGFITTMFFLFPIIIWNINNKFITYTFHSQRVTNQQIHFDSLLREIIGEALYQNPIIFILIVISLIYTIKQIKYKTIKQFEHQTPNALQFLLFLSLPMIFLFWFISLRNDIFPHWSGPAYIPLYIIAAIYLSEKTNKKFPTWIKASAVLIVVALTSITLLANFAPFNLGNQDKKNYGEYCPTLDISGWRDFSISFKTLVNKDFAANKMNSNASIIVNKWFPACQLELYTSRKTGLRILAIGNLDNIHHFAWLNQQRNPLQIGDDAYCIVPSNVPINVEENYGKYFTTIEKPDTINQIRSNAIVRYFYIWRLKNCKQVPAEMLKF
jgi:4-amino-4-deoxy-L-arabinose transferase-like glycosyltransferase